MFNLLVSLLLIGTSVLASGNFQAKITELKSGRITEAKAVWWGFDKNDATHALQSALNSGAKRIIIENTGSDWIVRPIHIPSNVEVVLMDGVVIRAKKGEFKDPMDSLLNIVDRENVTLRGVGKALLVMNKKDYQNRQDYRHSEWRHTINIVGSKNVSVDNLTTRASGGDGVYVGRKNCENIRLTNLTCIDHHRQGISITGVKKLYAANCRFNETRGTAPQSGVDIEPNDGNGLTQDILFENCEFNGNQHLGIDIYNPSCFPVRVTFRNCLIKGNAHAGIGMPLTGGGHPAEGGKIEFDKCRIEGHSYAGIYLGEHTVPNLKLVFKDCTIDNRKSSSGAVILSSDSAKDIHGIEIRNLTVLDDQSREPVVFISRYGNALIDPVVEKVVTRNSQGKSTTFDAAKFIRQSAPDPAAKNFKVHPADRKTLRPVATKGKAGVENLRLRGTCEFLVYATKGSRIPIQFHHRPVRMHATKKNPPQILLSTPTVMNVEHIKVPFSGRLNYELDAQETGIYQFRINSGLQTLTINCSAPGQGYTTGNFLYLFQSSGQLYFAVPPRTDEVAVELTAFVREEADVALLNAQGTVVGEVKKLSGTKILTAPGNRTNELEIWSIRFKADKLQVRLRTPIPQFFATSPENILAELPSKEAK